MERRTRRYENDSVSSGINRMSRSDRNKYLYEDVNNIIEVNSVSNLDTQTRIDLSKISSYDSNREDFRKIKEYKEIFPQKEKVEQKPIEKNVNRSFDINDVLEEAKKNRVKYDEIESKRKLRENQYATMADINDKERYTKNSPSSNINEEELTNLINTITSHSLVDEIKEAEKNGTKIEGNPEETEEILSELLATNVDINLEKGIAEEFTTTNEVSKMDDSFYTKSMDLSEQDFELKDEIEKDKSLKVKIAVVICIILVIIGAIAFVLLKKKGII